eukprot:3940299-Rhodomonas_salina.5
MRAACLSASTPALSAPSTATIPALLAAATPLFRPHTNVNARHDRSCAKVVQCIAYVASGILSLSEFGALGVPKTLLLPPSTTRPHVSNFTGTSRLVSTFVRPEVPSYLLQTCPCPKTLA